MRTPAALALTVAALAACAPTDDDGPAAEIAWCDGTTRHRYDPQFDPQLAAFPDDLWTRDDPTSPTGQRVDVTDAAWLAEMPLGIVPVEPPLEVLSGWGRLGALVLRANASFGALPTDAAASTTDAGLRLVDLSSGARVPFTVTVGEDGTQLLVQPLQILRPGTRHALVLTTDHVAADGGCVAPSAALRDLLAGDPEDDRLARVAPRYRDALTTLELAPEDVSAMVVFTTHDDTKNLWAAAEDARTQTLTWAGDGVCEPSGTNTHCVRPFVARDYRATEGAVLGADAVATWTLDVHIWLPPGEGPFPTVLVGHGLGGRGGDGAGVDDDLNAAGYAVVSVDALHHGTHPTSTGESDPVAFLGMDFTNIQLDAFALRGSFEQTPLDRIQLLELIRQQPDLDGDGDDDVDATRLGYWGVSLGGLLGPGVLALDGSLRAGVLSVGGGHLVAFARYTQVTELLQPLFVELLGSEDGLERFLALAQAAIDPADPAVIATHVLTDRFDEAEAPDVLLPVAKFDEVVPPAAGEMLARGLGLPHVAPVAWEVEPLVAAGAVPLSGNGPDGATVGYFQLDRRTDGEGVLPADHPGTPYSPEALLQALHFLGTWSDGGHAEILDPYAELGTPALP